MSGKWSGKERRNYKRITKNFILSYCNKAHPHQKHEITQLKNISLGGMCFITSTQYEPGTILMIDLDTPYIAEKTHLEGKVIESTEKVKKMLYETRLEFLELKPEVQYLMEKMMDFFMNGDKKNYA